MSTVEFVKGWLLLDTLGEGRFGEVKLLMNQDSNEMVAVKVLIIKNLEMEKQIKKEICIHKNLQNKNIINFFGNRRDPEQNIEYLFLEYAQNGELFEQIEPDIGMEKLKAYKYFTELLNGLEYLHQKGIVHRDIKPENLLLDSLNQLKISDFGMATLFRYNGKERLLNQICGSMLYMAPEILLEKPHRAEPIDIWSSGIVFVAMLSGQLPWSKANEDDQNFKLWLQGKFNLHIGIWSKIDTITLSLIKSILESNPNKRFKLEQIKLHRAYLLNNPNNQSNRIKFQQQQQHHYYHSNKRQCINNGFSSQPLPNQIYSSTSTSSSSIISSNDLMETDDNYCDNNNSNYLNHQDHQQEDDENFLINWNSFSQPNRIQDMFLSTQTQIELGGVSSNNSNSNSSITPPGTKLYHQIVKRMTRFFTKKSYQETIEILEKSFDDLNWSWKKQSLGQYKITMTDKNRIPLVFRCFINELSSEKILIEFRLSKGDCIEFKRKFIQIKNLLQPIIEIFPINNHHHHTHR